MLISRSPGDLNFENNVPWLLAPNKTDALSYLSDDGPKPGRFARIRGSADCYSREYMVGYVNFMTPDEEKAINMFTDPCPLAIRP